MAGLDGNGNGADTSDGQQDFLAALDIGAGGLADVDKGRPATIDGVISAYKPMSVAEEKRLVRAAQGGDMRARDRLIERNVGFMASTCIELCREGQDWRELLGAAAEGMAEAIARFSADQDTRLITYAVWWIRQRVKTALREGWLVRQPGNWAEARRRIWARSDATGETFAEAGAALGISKRVMAGINQTLERLDEPWGEPWGDERQERTRGEVMADDRIVDEADVHEREQTAAVVREVLATLDDREQKIIAQRFGFDGGDGAGHCGPVSLEMVGQEWGVTRERIRQIERFALQKLAQRLKARGIGPEHLEVFSASAIDLPSDNPRRTRAQIYQRQRYYEKVVAKRPNRSCPDCGVDISSRHTQAQRCEACAKVRNKAMAVKRYIERGGYKGMGQGRV